jgi:hypothetical protein
MLTLLANYINHVQAFDLVRPELRRLFQAQRVYRLRLRPRRLRALSPPHFLMAALLSKTTSSSRV